MTAVYHGPSRLVFVRFGTAIATGRTVEEALGAMRLLLSWKVRVGSC